MVKLSKKILLLISIILFIPNRTYALESNTPSENNLYKSYSYVIDSYNVDINVNENNTFDIIETITAYFNTPKHGIYRTIPLKNTIERLDGTTSTNRTQVTNVSVDNEYTTTKEDGNYIIKIGSASQTLTGKQTYVIKYTYNIGKDPMSEYDELYYNIIGNEWDTVIGNVTFKITMPKEFDSSKLGFSKGSKGSISSDNVNYDINGNIITGSYKEILKVGEALTVRLQLEEGYFVNARVNMTDYMMLLIPIIFLGIIILLWYKYGRDEKVIETIEFYPPENLNSLEIGYLYKGEAKNEDAVSLLIYLANKGYLKIDEIEGKTLFFKTKDFKITKLKEYDGNNYSEQVFLNGLFKRKNVVTSQDLSEKFHTTIDRILKNINSKKNKNKIFEKAKKFTLILIKFLIAISLYLIILIPTFKYDTEGLTGFTIFITSTYILILMFIMDNNSIRSMLPSAILLIFLLSTFRILPIYDAICESKFYLIGVIFGVICVIVMCIFYLLMPKRNSYGNEILGKIKGFKTFLETARKDELEALVTDNPTYFYDILPYTYVLGVSSKWIKQFESISLKAPDWYNSQTDFNINKFETFFNRTMASATSVMTSSPMENSGSSSSDFSNGSSSGGGFSGGGSGGGGGGSW